MAKWRVINDATGDTVAEFGDSGALSCASVATNALTATTIVGTGALTATGAVKTSDKFIFAGNNGVSQTIAINCANTSVFTLRFEGGILTANTVA